jgi:hypothetical protein
MPTSAPRWLPKAFGVAVLVVCAVLAACSRAPDEERLRAAMAAMQDALEDGKPADFMQHVSADFTGADGSVDREALHTLLRAQVLGNASIGIMTGPVDIERDDDRATVRVTATFTGGNARWLPERGSIYRLTSGWRKVDGEWQCFNAQWERTL